MIVVSFLAIKPIKFRGLHTPVGFAPNSTSQKPPLLIGMRDGFVGRPGNNVHQPHKTAPGEEKRKEAG